MRGIDLLKDIGTIDDSLIEEAAQPLQAKSLNRIDWNVWTRWGSLAAGFVVLCVAAVAFQQSFRMDHATETACSVDTASYQYPANDCAAPEKTVTEADVEEDMVADRSVKTSEDTNYTGAKDATAATEEKKELQIVKNYSMEKEMGGETVKMEQEVCYAVPEKGEYFYFIELEQALEAYQGQTVQYYVAIDIFGDCKNTEGETVYEELTYSETSSDKQTSQIITECERLLAEGYEVIIEEEELRGYFTEEELKSFVANAEYGYAFRFVEE